ncbi:hypothetical protein NUH88_14140 [Nisaea acidiphila]|uniref:Uncharacterized protein n=1 Tax=Nisaea acidiphila TaxID=1862145 RepID=A0A9J7AT58_9PROT|nr:hypothetical protein [Nisaea acidiphila]UUX48549.1 hypothetical protein NUH88_14140 [Nisaea acidiphila]
MEESTKSMVEEAYFETVEESFERGLTPLKAHMEGVVAAAMLLSAVEGVEDEAARKMVMELGLRPQQEE